MWIKRFGPLHQYPLTAINTIVYSILCSSQIVVDIHTCPRVFLLLNNLRQEDIHLKVFRSTTDIVVYLILIAFEGYHSVPLLRSVGHRCRRYAARIRLSGIPVATCRRHVIVMMWFILLPSQLLIDKYLCLIMGMSRHRECIWKIFQCLEQTEVVLFSNSMLTVIHKRNMSADNY